LLSVEKNQVETNISKNLFIEEKNRKTFQKCFEDYKINILIFLRNAYLADIILQTNSTTVTKISIRN